MLGLAIITSQGIPLIQCTGDDDQSIPLDYLKILATISLSKITSNKSSQGSFCEICLDSVAYYCYNTIWPSCSCIIVVYKVIEECDQTLSSLSTKRRSFLYHLVSNIPLLYSEYLLILISECYSIDVGDHIICS